MKIMITGGAGFLGSNLTKRLLKEGNEVWCVDDLSTGRLSNLIEDFRHPNFYFCKADILEDNLLEVGALDRLGEVHFLCNETFDQIYHLASPASPPKYQMNPLKTFRINTEGTYRVLEFARRCGARVCFSSTSECYGDPQVHPQHEEYFGYVNFTGIRSCYDESKRGGETLCCDYYRTHGTKIMIARIFNVYGPKMDPGDGRVVSNMICQAIKGQDLTVYGDGNQTRSFTYVEDNIDGLIRLMNSNLFCMPVNIGNTNEFTIKELAENLISEHFAEKDLKIIYKPLPMDDPKQRKPDISRAQTLLGWEPKISLKEGLVPTIEYFKKELAKKV